MPNLEKWDGTSYKNLEAEREAENRLDRVQGDEQ